MSTFDKLTPPALALVLSGALLACKNPTRAQGTSSASASTAVPDPPVTRNASIEAAVRAMAKNCSYDASSRNVKCEGEQRTSATKAVEALPGHDPSLLETLSDLLAHESDMAVVTFAGLLFNDVLESRIRPALDPKTNPGAATHATPATARRLLVALPRVSKLEWLVAPITLVTASAGLVDQTLPVIDALPASADGKPRLRRAGYSGIAKALGGRALDALRHYAKTDSASAVGVLYDLGTFSAETANALCPFLGEHLASTDPDTRASAIELTAASCPVAPLDAAIARLEKAAMGKVEQALVRPYQRVAERLGADAGKDPVSKALGARVHAVALRLVRDETQERGARYMAAYMLASFDDAETLLLCSTESKNPKIHVLVREQLAEGVKRIRARQKGKHAAPAR